LFPLFKKKNQKENHIFFILLLTHYRTGEEAFGMSQRQRGGDPFLKTIFQDPVQGLPFQISVEDIDHLLTSDADINRSSLWVPQRVRAPEHGGSEHPQGGQIRPMADPVQDRLNRHGGSRTAPDVTHMRSGGVDRPMAMEMGPPGEHMAQMPPAASYGAVHSYVEHSNESALPARYKRIEKVALSIGLVCSMVFLVSLSGQGGGVTGAPSSSALAGRAHSHTLSKLGATCTLFLCPTSGHCASSADKCPEGNPFLKAGVYRDLIDCKDSEAICTRAAGTTSAVTFKDAKVAIALAAEGAVNGKFKACDGFLCPLSGSCQIAPANCTEVCM